VGPIQFGTKRLSLTYKHSTAVVTTGEWIFDPEMAVLGKFTVAGNKNVKENWVRCNLVRCQKELITGWQQQDRTLHCRGRVTEKHV
jgi:hypothetical protein